MKRELEEVKPQVSINISQYTPFFSQTVAATLVRNLVAHRNVCVPETAGAQDHEAA